MGWALPSVLKRQVMHTYQWQEKIMPVFADEIGQRPQKIYSVIQQYPDKIRQDKHKVFFK
ncbi:hypothetical protein HanRHA438_Chr04g0195821 [Helianthus annuus]|nr:hypothetical protein HanRHA438_Chr04g0195821 [Helianthus annuus]